MTLFRNVDLKTSLAQTDSLNHPHQTSQQSHNDRHLSKSLHSPSNLLSSASTNSSRTHSSVAGALHTFGSLHSPSIIANSSASGTQTQNTGSITSQSLIPAKYDFAHNAAMLHTNAVATSTHSSIGPSSNNNNNSTHNASYMHVTNNLQPQLTYGNVKSESNANTYDYMNSCLQNGYFNGSFGALGGSAVTQTPHTVSDLAGYHHQHNVIQAAKLMATS